MMKKVICNEDEMLVLAQELAATITAPCVIFLSGNLGAGKTTFVRGLLRGWHYQGAVKSPTFTVVETYALKNFTVNHFDLYRIMDPEELELIGIRDYFMSNAIVLIEWPERALAKLPKPDISIQIDKIDDKRELRIEFRLR